MSYQKLGTFLKKCGLLDPDIVLRKTRIQNFVKVEIRSHLVDIFQLANTNNNAGLPGVHGEILAVLEVMLQLEEERSAAPTILANYIPNDWKLAFKLASVSLCLIASLKFFLTN